MQNRVKSLDILRGLAVFLMIIFHFSFDLDYLSFITLNIDSNIFWKIFRYTIVSSFIFSFGYSIVLSNKIFNLKKTIKRLSLLLFFSSVITVSTYLIFPNSWIYFGILHFLFLSNIFALLFLRFHYINLIVISALLFILYKLNILDTSYVYNHVEDILSLPARSEDLVRFFPWFSLVLFSMAMAKLKVFEKISIKKNIKVLNYFSKYSLYIYIIHQPILFGTLFIIKKIYY